MSVLRPLRGEPICLDLANTEWIEDGKLQDLLNSTAGLDTWLKEVGLEKVTLRLEETREALIEARAAIRAVLTYPRNPKSEAALNAVLEKGVVRERLGPDGPEEIPEVPKAWYPAWLAAKNLLHLLKTSPARIRACSNSDCILYFFDTTKNGSRTWCGMGTCGNRAKARRHYQRKKLNKVVGSSLTRIS